MTRHSEWTPHWETFFEKSFQASSSRNRIKEGVGSEDEVEALKHKGLWDRADLRFGTIDMTNVNKRENGKKETTRKAPNNSNITSILKREYTYMGNAWTCDMQKKLHHGLNPIQTYQYTSSSTCITQLNAWKYSYNAHGMQCMKFLRLNLQNPSKNCTKISLILKNPKFWKNPKNLGFKEWNTWKWENWSLPSEEKLD